MRDEERVQGPEDSAPAPEAAGPDSADGGGAAALSYALPSTPSPGESHAGGVTRGDVAVLALRLLAIYMMLEGSAALALVPTAFSFARAGADAGRVLALIGPSGAVFGLGIVLLAAAGWLGPKLLPGSHRATDAGRRATARDYQAVAFSVVGLLVVVWSVAHLSQGLWIISFQSRYRPDVDTTMADAGPHLLRFGLECAVGIAVFLGARGLSAFWHRLREPNAGRDPTGEPETGPPAEDETSAH
jgi:hypothetical protein